MKENILIPAGTASIDVETIVKINAGTVTPPVNKPPVVIVTAPVNITLPATLILTATASDPDGSIASYLWTKVSGGTAIITNQDKAIATVSGLVAGAYVFKIEVTDNNGAKISANTPSIAVKETTPQTLVAKAGVDAVLTLPANYIILDGIGSTGTNAITAYLWSYISGPTGYNIDNPNSARSGFSGLVAGIYIFRLAVTDSAGAKSTDDITVTVKAGAVVTPPVEPPTPPPAGTGYLALPISPAATYNNVNGLIIEGKRFSNINNAINQNGNILRFFGGSNITIRNCFFGEASGGDLGGDRAIYFTGCNNITVENCLFSDQGGAILVSSHGNGMVIRNNEFMNVRGPYPKGNFIQLNTCNGSGYVIEKNRGENFYGESYPEDIVSMFTTSGTAASPILIQDNLWRGGGSSTTGGGGTAGDHLGSNIIYQRNKLFNPGQYGLGVGGGNNHKVLNNWIWQEQKPWSANGIVAYAYSPPCTNVQIVGNMVHVVCGLAIRCTPGGINNSYLPNECTFIGDPKAGVIDFTDVKLMNFPAKLITFISEDEIWRLRHSTKKHEALIISTAQKPPQNYTAQSISRPTASATYSSGALRSTSIPSAGNSISASRWVQVKGPNNAVITSPNAAVTTVTGLVTGQYIFRLEVSQANNASLKVITEDAAWVTINN